MRDSMERLTTRHCEKAVIKDKSLLSKAMEKLARYEEMEEQGCKGCHYENYEKTAYPCATCARSKQDRYETTEEKNLDSLELSIDTLGLSTRAYNCIRRAGINSIRALCSKTPKDLMRIRDMGVKTLDEIIQKMDKQGLELKKEKEK